MSRVFIVAVLLTLVRLSVSAGAISLGTFAVNPQSSFLYESSNDSNVAALFINLASLGVTAGETLQISGVGDGECYYGLVNCPPESPVDLGGVFDANNTLLASSSLTPCTPQPNCTGGNVDRLTGTRPVPGIGPQPLVTNNSNLDTYYGNVNTTIPSDFYIPSGAGITVVVPTGAAFLVAGVLDSYYADDFDPSGTLGVQITEITSNAPPTPSTVPEPATRGMFAAGMAGLLAYRRLRAPFKPRQ